MEDEAVSAAARHAAELADNNSLLSSIKSSVKSPTHSTKSSRSPVVSFISLASRARLHRREPAWLGGEVRGKEEKSKEWRLIFVSTISLLEKFKSMSMKICGKLKARWKDQRENCP